MIVLFISVYIVGCITAFMLLTGEEYQRILDDLINFGCAPRYKAPLQSMYILFGLFGSWAIALAVILNNRQEGKTSCSETSFKNIWNIYEGGEKYER